MKAAAVALAVVARYPEPGDAADSVSAALGRLADTLDWCRPGRGPLGGVIAPGARVLVKPNFVLHRNEGTGGMEPMVTHASLVRAAVAAALAAGAGEVTVGDAPLQSCAFDALLAATGLDLWAAGLAAREPRFRGIRDFRRTTCTVALGVRHAAEELQPEQRFVAFDLGTDSLLEPITDPRRPFRVCWYDPRPMARAHAPGRHHYLVAREVLEADVVLNLPKLKTHKKAGLTCALKNLIGINGNKEYLPHHRMGGSGEGGDCYPGSSAVKRGLEYAADRQNLAASPAVALFWRGAALGLTRITRLGGDRFGYEGSWSGNDTIWRTCLDLNRILLYGRPDGGMAEGLERRVVHIADAVVAGQGDGPLAPQPLPLGLVMGADNAVAMDWVAAHLLGYDPERLPLVRGGFARFRWPLAGFSREDVTVTGDAGSGTPAGVLARAGLPLPEAYPVGWRDAVAPSMSAA